MESSDIDWKCLKCRHKFFTKKDDSQELMCPKCGSKGEHVQRSFYQEGSGPMVIIKSHSGVYSKHGKTPDDGIPFGEVPGDEIYKDRDLDDPNDKGPRP